MRDCAFCVGLIFVLGFPLLPALWEFLGLLLTRGPATAPLLAVGMEAWDAGGQQPFARCLLRGVCGVLVLFSLLFAPTRSTAFPRWTSWGSIFLALGFVASLQAEHRFQAFREWQTWMFAGLLSYAVAAVWRRGASLACLLGFYGLAGTTVLHALWVSVPSTEGRLGGIFHHPNALSTFCLMLLVVTGYRCFEAGPDRLLAQISSGALLGLVMASGSLTGAAVLVGIVGWLVLPGEVSRTTKLTLALGSSFALVSANLAGGWWSVGALPFLLVGLWVVGWLLSTGHDYLGPSATVVLTAGLVLFVVSFLAPPESVGRGAASRWSSGAGRLDFYRAGTAMVAQHPWLGVGPGGFARHYPEHQESPRVYSKFIHSLPLEIASEWGLPALLAWLAMLGGAARQVLAERSTPQQRMAGWVVLVFFLHSLSGVQSQFPYLLMLAAVALGIIAGGDTERAPIGAPWVPGVTRSLLAVLTLALLALNMLATEAAYDRSLAMAIARRSRTEPSRRVVASLLGGSFLKDPLDSESARLWGVALMAHGDRAAAASIAHWAVELDPRRASCLLLELSADGPKRAGYEERLALGMAVDPVNYPTFHRLWAEELWRQGRAASALEVLTEQAKRYPPQELQELPDFRYDDLSDQLVEFWALKALLENAAQPGAMSAESDLRRALESCRSRVSRLRRLGDYPPGLGRTVKGRLGSVFEQLREDLPAVEGPASVETSLD